jgi:hypothetical protein
VVAHAFNPSTWEAEAGGFLSSRPAWSTEWVPGQPGLYKETLSGKTKKKKKKKKSIILKLNLEIKCHLKRLAFRKFYIYFCKTVFVYEITHTIMWMEVKRSTCISWVVTGIELRWTGLVEIPLHS